MWRHAESGFPGEDQGCPTCSFLADSIGHLSHLHACDTTLVLVSRAPIASIERFKKRMGWQVPWYSSYGSDFNYDFHVSFDEGKAPLEYNYKDKETLEREAPYIRSGTDGPGVSVFLRDADRVFHTYSAYERGLDSLLGTYRWLELAPLGRQRHVTEFPTTTPMTRGRDDHGAGAPVAAHRGRRRRRSESGADAARAGGSAGSARGARPPRSPTRVRRWRLGGRQVVAYRSAGRSVSSARRLVTHRDDVAGPISGAVGRPCRIGGGGG